MKEWYSLKMILTEQAKHMGLYLKCLEIRAEIEGVDLAVKH